MSAFDAYPCKLLSSADTPEAVEFVAAVVVVVAFLVVVAGYSYPLEVVDMHTSL